MSYEDPKILPSGTTFAQFQAAGVSGLLERLIAANAAAGEYTALDYQLVRAAKDGNLEDAYRRLRHVVYDFNRGSPVEHAAVLASVKKIHNAFAVLTALCAEAAALIDANPGAIIFCTTYQRTWPDAAASASLEVSEQCGT